MQKLTRDVKTACHSTNQKMQVAGDVLILPMITYCIMMPYTRLSDWDLVIKKPLFPVFILNNWSAVSSHISQAYTSFISRWWIYIIHYVWWWWWWCRWWWSFWESYLLLSWQYIMALTIEQTHDCRYHACVKAMNVRVLWRIFPLGC